MFLMAPVSPLNWLTFFLSVFTSVVYAREPDAGGVPAPAAPAAADGGRPVRVRVRSGVPVHAGQSGLLLAASFGPRGRRIRQCLPR